MNSNQLQELVNKNLTLEGKATDVRGGAALLVNNDPVYIEGLDYWPQDFIDKQVTLSGKLVFKSYIPKTETNENGLTSQGSSGDNNYVLEQAIIEIDKGDFGYKRLTDTGSFPQGQYQEAIKAIIIELENRKEDPEKFFVKFEPDTTASKFSFELIHQNTFSVKTYLKVVGNPSGKDRKAIYDLIQKKVTFLFYK